MFITEFLKNMIRLFGVNLIYEACFPFLVGPKRRMLYKYLFIFIIDTGLNRADINNKYEQMLSSVR